MRFESKPKNELERHVEPEPGYDDLPRGDFNPMWEVAIAIGILLGAMAIIVAFS